MGLIDADALKDALRKEQRWIVKRDGYHNEGFSYDQVMFAIDAVPTIKAEPNSCEYWDSESNFCALRRPQAEPIKHGRWLWLADVRCSNCNYKLQTTGLPSYCPNCGAKMDEAELDAVSEGSCKADNSPIDEQTKVVWVDYSSEKIEYPETYIVRMDEW